MNRAFIARLSPLLVGASLVIGCGSNSSKNASNTLLVGVGTASTTDCPNGGVVLTSGTDANGNGTLDAAEVTQTQNICNGASTAGMTGMTGTSAPGTLVSTTMLPVGDTNCVGGGTRIDTGLDNGASGGTADDGVLQSGEITATQYVCSGGQPSFPGAVTPPEGTGTSKINLAGGNGTTGPGGTGGYFRLRMEYGTLGGHVKVFNSGTVDASFTVPTITPTPGAVPVTVATTPTTPWATYANTTLGLGDPNGVFLVNGDNTIYKVVGGVATPATSVSVAAGVTLTLPLNNGGEAYLYVPNDFANAGTIKTALQGDAKSAGGLGLRCGSYLGATTSKIDLSGQPAAGSTGGTGGDLSMTCDAHCINQGAITTVGGAGDDGGDAGEIELDTSNGDIYNTGALTATGGAGSVGSGGGGGYIEFEGGYRGTWNSGAIEASGGAGVTNGGSGNELYIYTDYIGSTVNSGKVTAKGGTCSATNCNGGSGAPYYFADDTYSGDTLNSGDIDLSGADGKGTGSGGSGGLIYAYNYDDEEYNYAEDQYVPTGSIRFSGNIDLHGGAGASGGSGGYIDCYLEVYYSPQGQEIAFYGYTDINLSGGNSTGSTGGDAGSFELSQNDPSYPHGDDPPGPAGAAINYANINGKGGSGTNGGSGSAIKLTTQTSSNAFFNNPYEFVFSAGTINNSGGGSSAVGGSAGSAGEIDMNGNQHVTITGAITGIGGAATGATSTGGEGSYMYLRSDQGPVTVSAAIDDSGGAGGATGGVGGDGYDVYIYGNPVADSSTVTSNGGAAGATGGSGGYIELFSSPHGPTTHGTFSVNGGTATANGAKGSVSVDGADATP